MELFWKALAVSLTAAVLGIILGKKEKDISVLLALAASVAVLTGAGIYLKPVVEFLFSLEKLGNLHGDMLGILLKAVGIGLVTELSFSVCKDSGLESVGKALQLMGSIVILWLAIPVFQGILDLVQKILGEV